MCELGFTEWEVNHMRPGKWVDLFYHFRKMFNIRQERKTFIINERQGSLLDL